MILGPSVAGESASILILFLKLVDKVVGGKSITESYGAEFIAGRIAVEKIMEYRYKCRMLGLRITQPSVLLLDNNSVVAPHMYFLLPCVESFVSYVSLI